MSPYPGAKKKNKEKQKQLSSMVMLLGFKEKVLVT